MDAREVLGVGAKDNMYSVDKPYMELVRLYATALARAPYCVSKVIELLQRAVSANEALKWETWVEIVEIEDPVDDYSGKPSKEVLEQWLESYSLRNDLSYIEYEPDKKFRDKYFHGLDRVLLLVGGYHEIDLGDISEHDLDGRVRQGYLAEIKGNKKLAKQIYDSIGFKERKIKR